MQLMKTVDNIMSSLICRYQPQQLGYY